MPENNKKGVKKVFPAVLVLGATFYYSSLFAAGLLIGYLCTMLYCKKFGISEESLEKKRFLDFGKWNIHLHHWIMGILLVVLICLAGFRPEVPVFVWGMIVGMILQDIYDYNDWHQIILKSDDIK